jgi:hypothetical protein
MKLEIHHYHHYPELTNMSEQLDAIEAKVAELTTVAEGTALLLDEVAQLVRDNINDPARLEEILADLEANRANLAAATERNTDVDPTPPTEPPAP